MKAIVKYIAQSSLVIDIPDDIKVDSDEFIYYCNSKFINSNEYNHCEWEFDSYNIQLDENELE